MKIASFKLCQPSNLFFWDSGRELRKFCDPKKTHRNLETFNFCIVLNNLVDMKKLRKSRKSAKKTNIFGFFSLLLILGRKYAEHLTKPIKIHPTKSKSNATTQLKLLEWISTACWSDPFYSFQLWKVEKFMRRKNLKIYCSKCLSLFFMNQKNAWAEDKVEKK